MRGDVVEQRLLVGDQPGDLEADRLERRGLVARSREKRDRRVIITRITPAGLDLLRGLDRPIEEFNRKLLGNLGEPQLRTLIKLLEAARDQAG